RKLCLYPQRIDEAGIARQQLIIAQRRGKVRGRGRLGELERREADGKKIERRQAGDHEQHDQARRERATVEAPPLGVEPAYISQSELPARRRAATACSCAAFIASFAGNCPVATCSNALLRTSPTTGNSLVVR